MIKAFQQKSILMCTAIILMSAPSWARTQSCMTSFNDMGMLIAGFIWNFGEFRDDVGRLIKPKANEADYKTMIKDALCKSGCEAMCAADGKKTSVQIAGDLKSPRFLMERCLRVGGETCLQNLDTIRPYPKDYSYESQTAYFVMACFAGNKDGCDKLEANKREIKNLLEDGCSKKKNSAACRRLASMLVAEGKEAAARQIWQNECVTYGDRDGACRSLTRLDGVLDPTTKAALCKIEPANAACKK